MCPPAYLRGPEVTPVAVPYAFGCTGKVALTRTQAVIVQQRRYSRNQGPQRAYECRACGWWHTTSLAAEKRQEDPSA